MARVGGRVAEGLLSGEVSLRQGPSRYRQDDSNFIDIKYRRRKWELEMEKDLRTMRNFATTDYVSEHATPIEVYALKNISNNITSSMMKSSYSKTIASWYRGEDIDRVERVRVYNKPVREWFDVDYIWNLKVKPGVLAGFPLLNLIRGNIETDLLADLVDAAGGNGGLQGTELYEHAWGEAYTGSTFRGRLSYSDASMLSKKCNFGLIETFYPCFV
jgi:hypothetical protein